MAVQHVAVLTFGTLNGAAHTIRIPRAREDLAQTDVVGAMASILSVAALRTRESAGPINSKQRAVVQRITTTEIDVAP